MSWKIRYDEEEQRGVTHKLYNLSVSVIKEVERKRTGGGDGSEGMMTGEKRNVTTGEEREERDQVRDNGRRKEANKETRERKYCGQSGRNTDGTEDE